MCKTIMFVISASLHHYVNASFFESWSCNSPETVRKALVVITSCSSKYYPICHNVEKLNSKCVLKKDFRIFKIRHGSSVLTLEIAARQQFQLKIHLLAFSRAFNRDHMVFIKWNVLIVLKEKCCSNSVTVFEATFSCCVRPHNISMIHYSIIHVGTHSVFMMCITVHLSNLSNDCGSIVLHSESPRRQD